MILDAKPIIEELELYFPEVAALRPPVEEIRLDRDSAGRNADIANAIYECVGKNAWQNSGSAPPNKEIEKASIPQILKGAKQFFEVHDPNFYEEVWSALTVPAGRILGNRSTSGDVSHGHLPDKPELSFAHATMSLNLALSFAAYFFAILRESSAYIRYDDHKELGGFNEWLNSKGTPIGGASYSWLLYQHDYSSYESFYDEYQLLNEKLPTA